MKTFIAEVVLIVSGFLMASAVGENKADAQAPSLQGGDFLLVRTPNSRVAWISYWTHVAIADGKGNIIEAMPGWGVRKMSVNQFWANNAQIQVHRVRANSQVIGPRIATYAASQYGQPYQIFPMYRGMDCVELARQSFIYGIADWRVYWWLPDHIANDSRFVCVARK